ncbi:MAG: hypothetical protein CMC90_02430 [Flavobacteriaceae bacterium]|nr:hypothetical protein [Flavobacteriaceae bacterium]|tara:strand:+ start:4474 stop:4911 length:438 start_codon:yes stop_codon:yes gene_type:complete
MKDKILIFAILLVFSSCSIFKTSQTITENSINETLNDKVVSVNKNQKFLGDYAFEIKGIPSGDDGSLTIKVSADNDILKAELTGDSVEASSFFSIQTVEVEDDILFIEIFVPEYGITGFFELYVEGNEVTGYAFDMFEIIGTKTD